MKHLINIYPLALLTFLLACNSPSAKKETASDKDVLLENIDTTVSPADDFFNYANGKWIKDNPIPSTEKGWGVWSVVRNETLDRMKKISEEAAADKNASTGSNAQKIGDFYFSGMDSVGIDKNGTKPLQAEFDRINAIKDVKGLMEVVALFQTYGVSPLFSIYPTQDEKNSEVVTLHFYQGGIGLPDRDYYFNTDERTRKIREQYPNHIAKMLELSGVDESTAKKQSTAILKIETDLAKASRKIEDLRDPYKNYNKMSVDGMRKLAPTPDWKTVLTAMHINNVDSVILGQPEFYQAMDKELKSVSMDDWKAYLRWNLISSFASQLTNALNKENFNFYGTTLSGVKEQRPRWKRVLDEQENALGDALGQLYVNQYVSSTFKARYTKITEDIFDAYRNHIKTLDWMSDTTKQQALVKLNSVTKKVGYPDKWRDYSKVNINRNTYFENRLATNKNDFNFAVSKIGQPVDRTEWGTTPPTVTAYNNPPLNEIVFPAGILQPPYFDLKADDALNYGGIGMVIGHEITHSFDDQGALFDKEGNVKNWWQEDDLKKFKARTQQVIDQYNKFTVLDSMHVKGALTVGENTADIAGIAIAYDAFKLTKQGQGNEKIDGFTPDQRFFISIAKIWMVKTKDAFMRVYVNTNPHSPAKWRVNGPLMNFSPFYKAFDVKPGDRMYKPENDRISVW